MKIVFIVIDGLGDKPIPRLGNKTPLEAAKTKNLDILARNGACGLVLPFKFSWQEYPNSDTCHLALFGYNPKLFYLGRGPYEAAGAGINLREGDIALRANFGTVDKNLVVKDRRAGRISDTQPLVKSINGIVIDGVKFLVKRTFGHRAVLVMQGKNLSDKVSDGDPRKSGEKVKRITPKNKSRNSKYTAEVLNKFLERSYKILENHPKNLGRRKKGKLPGNYLLIRGPGKIKKTPSFYQRYKLKSACIAGGTLYKGIAKILGIKIIDVPGATGLPNTNLKNKFQAVAKTIKKYDFVFCHIKAADNLAEDGNFLGKKLFIEKIDKNLKPLLGLKDTLIVVTGDHSTCSLLKQHCSTPVPVLIFGKNKKAEHTAKFGERQCKKGSLGTIPQPTLFPKIMGLAKK